MTKVAKKIQATKKIVGIDISKATFDVYYQDEASNEVYRKYDNTEPGIGEFVKSLPSSSHCVMEVTGTYHTRLAYALHNAGILVSLVNPLSVKHFSRMLMCRAKTDKSDARLIYQYAHVSEITPWNPAESYFIEIQQMYSLLEHIEESKRAVENQKEAWGHSSIQSSDAQKSADCYIHYLEREIKALADRIECLMNEHHKEELENLRSIPGIGKKASIVLMVATKGMTGFSNYRQLSAYFGLCPRIYESGSSVRSKNRICKVGLAWVRKMLYVCSWSAIRCNKACRELYQRLTKKGKCKKLALIAVVNKLLKQSFAVIKKNQKYDENYCSLFAY